MLDLAIEVKNQQLVDGYESQIEKIELDIFNYTEKKNKAIGKLKAKINNVRMTEALITLVTNIIKRSNGEDNKSETFRIDLGEYYEDFDEDSKFRFPVAPASLEFKDNTATLTLDYFPKPTQGRVSLAEKHQPFVLDRCNINWTIVKKLCAEQGVKLVRITKKPGEEGLQPFTSYKDILKITVPYIKR